MIVELNKSQIVSLLLFSIVLFQSSPWFVWSLGYAPIAIFAVVLFFLIFERFFDFYSLYKNRIILIVLVVLYFLVLHSVNSFRFSSLITILVFISLLVISDKEKCNSIRLLNKYYALILAISFIGWFVHSYLFLLPDFGRIEYVMLKDNAENIILKNHGIFIQLESDLVNRFYGIFDEPGVVGTLNAFLLYINGFNLRKRYNWIYLVTGIFTYSFAFVVLFFVGIVFTFSKGFLQVFKISALVALFSSFIFFLFKDNNTFQLAIINRIGNVSEKTEGRTSVYLNKFFDDFITSKDAFFGKGTSFYSESWHLFSGGQSYKIFLIEYGIVGFFLVFSLYLSISYRNKKIIGLLVLFCFSFIQRPFMFTPWEIILYSIGVSYLLFNKKYYLNHA